MKGNEEEHEILHTLIRIEQRLDEVSSLLRLGNRGEIEKVKAALLNSSVRKKVYNLCDGNHTVSEMASKLKKKGPNISRALADLEEAGLVQPLRLGKGVLYERII